MAASIIRTIKLDMINKRLGSLPAQDIGAVDSKLKLALGIGLSAFGFGYFIEDFNKALDCTTWMLSFTTIYPLKIFYSLFAQLGLIISLSL